jgi:hypothetical protein
MQHKTHFTALSVIGLLGVALIMSAGCNSGIDLGKVTGRVTKNGKPQPKLLVNFSPGPGARGSQGFTDENGQYQLIYTTEKMGAVTGPQHVTITSESNSNQNLLSKDVEVTSGSQTIDFDLGQGGAEKASK